jgi:hypothetical protein
MSRYLKLKLASRAKIFVMLDFNFFNNAILKDMPVSNPVLVLEKI